MPLPNTPTGAHERLRVRSQAPHTFNLHLSIVTYDFKTGDFTGLFDVQPDKSPAVAFKLQKEATGFENKPGTTAPIYVDDTYGLTWEVVSGGN